jgi:LysR family transcriptional regulator, glycine cleavage system transcriptional activator
VLTPAGEACLPDVRAAFARLRAATDELRRPQQGRVLMVSVTPTLAAKWLVPRLAAFYSAHPEIEVRINTTMRMVNFAREHVDMAIRYGAGVWPGLRSDRLPMAEDVFPVCSPALLRGGRPLRTLADLAGHTLLTVDYQPMEWRLWLSAAGASPEIAADLMRRAQTFDVAYMAIEAAIDGLGVALGYAPYVEADLAAGRLAAPFNLSLPCCVGFDAYLVCPERVVQAPAISVFRDWLLADAGTSVIAAAGMRRWPAAR